MPYQVTANCVLGGHHLRAYTNGAPTIIAEDLLDPTVAERALDHGTLVETDEEVPPAEEPVKARRPRRRSDDQAAEGDADDSGKAKAGWNQGKD